MWLGEFNHLHLTPLRRKTHGKVHSLSTVSLHRYLHFYFLVYMSSKQHKGIIKLVSPSVFKGQFFKEQPET